jgi:signal transduction histidine kinase
MSNNQVTVSHLNNEMPGQCARSTARLPGHEADVDQLTILAHELRTYLTPIYAHLTALYARAQRDDRAQDIRAVTRGRQALDDALTLLANLLDAAHMERGVFDLTVQPLNLCLLVQQAVETFDTEATRIVAHVPEALTVHADRERLRQVLHNLLANALSYAPRGASVTLEVTTECRDRTVWGVLMIRNGGPGIPPHLLAQLFERFSAGPNSHGLGLGLYLARGITEAHGGTLTAHSSDESGTCFILALPLPNGVEAYLKKGELV